MYKYLNPVSTIDLPIVYLEVIKKISCFNVGDITWTREEQWNHKATYSIHPEKNRHHKNYSHVNFKRVSKETEIDLIKSDALVHSAVKRGFIIGAKYKPLNSGYSTAVVSKEPVLFNLPSGLKLEAGTGYIYVDGVWADIIKDEKSKEESKVTTFLKDQYIVVLKNSNRTSRYPENYVFKQRVNSSIIKGYSDFNGPTKTTGSGFVKFNNNNESWRFATVAEMMAYDRNGPYKLNIRGSKEFVKGDYIVLLKTVSCEAFKKDYIFKQRATYRYLRAVVDLHGCTSNGWSSITIENTKDWRRATTDEVLMYNKNGGPCSITEPIKSIKFLKGSYIVPLTLRNAGNFTNNYVYKQRVDNEYLQVFKDDRGDKNGVPRIGFVNKNAWRFASLSEIKMYEEKNKPVNTIQIDCTVFNDTIDSSSINIDSSTTEISLVDADKTALPIPLGKKRKAIKVEPLIIKKRPLL